MDNVNDSEMIFARFPFLWGARRFFVFARVWWDGNGFDSVVWWEDSTIIHRTIVETGETTDFKEAKLVAEETLTSQAFEELLDDLKDTGWMDVPSQQQRLHFAHYDHYFGVKLSALQEPHLMSVAGGKHGDPRVAELLGKIENHCPNIT